MSSILLRYIDAWVSGDPARILRLVSTDCTVIESYGPVYEGRERVAEWAEAWFSAGGLIHGWIVRSHFETGDHEVAEWTFDCTWEGRRSRFDGCSIATVSGGLLTSLREYQTTAPLYDWRSAG